MTLAIEAVNREFLTVDGMAAEMMRGAKDDDAISFGYRVARPLRAQPGEQRMSLDDVTEAAGDCVESWLFDAWAKPSRGGEIAKDLAPVAAGAMRRYSIQHALNDLWNECCWEGLRLEGVMYFWKGGSNGGGCLQPRFASHTHLTSATMNGLWSFRI